MSHENHPDPSAESAVPSIRAAKTIEFLDRSGSMRNPVTVAGVRAITEQLARVLEQKLPNDPPAVPDSEVNPTVDSSLPPPSVLDVRGGTDVAEALASARAFGRAAKPVKSLTDLAASMDRTVDPTARTVDPDVTVGRKPGR